MHKIVRGRMSSTETENKSHRMASVKNLLDPAGSFILSQSDTSYSHLERGKP